VQAVTGIAGIYESGAIYETDIGSEMRLSGLRCCARATKHYESTGCIVRGVNMGTSNNHGDMRAHQETYSGVMGLLKWGTVASAIVAAIVIFLIAG
jgi:hypothetical protein